jgi:hypothetical protein
MTGALFPVSVFIFLSGLLLFAWRMKKVQDEREEANWDDLIQKLVPLSKVGIEEVACSFLAPSGRELDPRRREDRLESRDIWDFIGGIEGLKAMRRNAAVLIDLACYVQRWNSEAFVVAEQLRLDASEIRAALAKIRFARWRGDLGSKFPIHAARAAAAYYLMTQRLCALYEISQTGLLLRLKAAI